jgi:aspartyl-tRNA(Asn)/glutamyl-tRNA(Gln) amidotransferase subunit C
MVIDKNLLEKLMDLAKLELSGIEEEGMLKDLNKIGAWIEKLQEVDTTKVAPLANVSFEQDIYREDVAEQPLTHDRALTQAPRRDSNYFRVPQVKAST